MKTIKTLKKSLKELGLNRFKIEMHDTNNVTMHVPAKHVLDCLKLAEKEGIPGVNYQAKNLPFWKCRIENIQTIEPNRDDTNT
jgi:pseudouridine-5'-phosphate glycosidase